MWRRNRLIGTGLALLIAMGGCRGERRARHHPQGQQPETFGSSATTPATEPTTTSFGPWDVQTLWHWEGAEPSPGQQVRNVFSPPAVGQLTDDDGDGLIGPSDVPDVVVSAFGTGMNAPMLLVALDGRDGSPLWAVRDQTEQGSSVAVADVDLDGVPEVLAVGVTGNLLAFTNEGDPLWGSSALVSLHAYRLDPIAVADIEGDGDVEVLVSGSVLDGATGALVATLGDRISRPRVADLEGDGTNEILVGRRVFEASGTLRFETALEAPPTFGLLSEVVQADGDPEGEIWFYGERDTDDNASVWAVHDPDGTLLFEGEAEWEFGTGAPCVADIDGDGITEVIRSSFDNWWVATELDGTEIWRRDPPFAVGSPGCTIADLDGDGGFEVILTGGVGAILDARTGVILVGPLEVGYGLQFGGAAVVDLDGNGSTEVILGGNDYVSPNDNHGVIALSHAGVGWTAGAPSWPTSTTNQGAFDAMGTPLAPQAWWQSGDPVPGP